MNHQRIFTDVKRRAPRLIKIGRTGPDFDETKKNIKSHSRESRKTSDDLLATSVVSFPRKEHPFWKRTKEMTVFLIVGLIVVSILNVAAISKYGLETKDNLTLAAYEGISALQEGVRESSKSNFDKASLAFDTSLQKFKEAENQMWFLAKNSNSGFLEPLDSAQAAVAAGKNIAEAGKIFIESAKNLEKIPEQFFGNSKEASYAYESDRSFSLDIQEIKKPSLTEPLKKELPNIQKALDRVEKAGMTLEKVDESILPKENQKEFLYGKNLLTSLSSEIEKISEGLPGILTLLGDTRPHRILVLFQNNGELRPTGGFIGSYTLLEFNDGYLTKNEFHDVYETDYQLKEFIEPPEETKALSPRWFLRDSNYSPDFSVSAEKAAWFLQKSKGPSVDSVIAIDQSVLEDLLGLTGPVYVPSLNNFLTKDNFNIVVSFIIESKFTGRENPKAVLSEFMPIFQRQLFETQRSRESLMAEMIKVFGKAIREKHLMAYSREPDVQAFFEAISADSKWENVQSKNEDYLQIVETNIGGNKSDMYIDEKIIHETVIKRNGEIDDIVTIEKTHTWDAEDTKNVHQILNSFGFTEVPLKIKDIMGRAKNVTQMRIYVPNGARILEINGVPLENIFIDPPVTAKKDPDTGQTYFFTKMETERGQTKTLKIRYRLPFRLRLNPAAEYHLRVQKQMGVRGVNFEKTFSPEAPIELLKSLSSCKEILKTDCSMASLWKN